MYIGLIKFAEQLVQIKLPCFLPKPHVAGLKGRQVYGLARTMETQPLQEDSTIQTASERVGRNVGSEMLYGQGDASTQGIF